MHELNIFIANYSYAIFAHSTVNSYQLIICIVTTKLDNLICVLYCIQAFQWIHLMYVCVYTTVQDEKLVKNLFWWFDKLQESAKLDTAKFSFLLHNACKTQ